MFRAGNYRGKRRQNRRGITLVFVVSMIVLFMLLGSTFAVVSANYLKSSKLNARREIYRDRPEIAMERALYAMLRGDTNLNSPLRGHDIAADIYGYKGFKVTVDTPFSVGISGNQFIAFDTANSANQLDSAGTGTTLADYAGAYNGQVLTFIDGPAKGISSRIVGYSYDPTSTPPCRFYIMLEASDQQSSPFFNGGTVNTALANSRFIVNGRPFIGKGSGLLASSRTNPDAVPANEAAFVGITGPDNEFSPLRPNRVNDTTSGIASHYMQLGPNENYDAVDYQNMFLGGVIQTGRSYDDVYVIPSFHRPQLIDYARAAGINLNGVDARPFFMGPIANVDTNSDFDAVDLSVTADAAMDEWQVDNDGDYINDSIWIDIGLPLQTDASGRQFKILVAPLIVDLDGRLNVNAHGTKHHRGQLYDTTTSTAIEGYRTAYSAPATLTEFPNTLTDSGSMNVSTNVLPNRGQGYSPAEISLRTSYLLEEDYDRLLIGNANVWGRYGDDAGANEPGVDGIDTILSRRLFGYPAVHFGGWFASHMDIQGRSAIGLDINGVPRFDISAVANEYENHPAELDLVNDSSGIYGKNITDGVFAASELERLLRANDIDASTLPDRLWNTTTDLHAASTSIRDRSYRTRKSLTTHQFDLPVPGRDLPKMLRDILNGSLDPALEGGDRRDAIAKQVQGMLGADIMLGLKMNVNLPFGDGVDNNGNNIRDEHAVPPDPAMQNTPADVSINESVSDEPLWGGLANFDHDADGTTGAADANNDSYLARQHFARKLFVLTVLLNRDLKMDLDDRSQLDDGNPSRHEARAIIAQWVANVVDYRDTDSIMTPFEFDLNPLDGWHLDGYIGSVESPPDFDGQPSRFVCWGAERPELLISESFASHDRRTEDRSDDNGTPPNTTYGMPNPDDDFDQRLRPEGAFFVELFNPWYNTAEVPVELYDTAPTTGVNLKKLSAIGNSPVWRILVVKGGNKDKDPDETASTRAADKIPVADKERSIYFCEAANVPTDDHGQVFLPNKTTVLDNIGNIGVRQYAVIGSGKADDIDGDPDLFTTLLGFRNDVSADPNKNDFTDPTTDFLVSTTRRFELSPTNGTFRFYETGKDETRNCVAVPVEGFTVSEPVSSDPNAYPPAAFNGKLHTYATVRDEPLDNNVTGLNREGNEYDFREIHLQRLANPLAAFHAVTNPYRTIDSASVDLTVFNGMGKNGDTIPESEKDVRGWANTTIEFSSTERGEYVIENSPPTNDNQRRAQLRKLWTHEPNSADPGMNTGPGAGDHEFDFSLEETFGKVNYSYDLANPVYGGTPISVKWLNWNNRPFVSQLEMMLVPKGKPSQLLKDHTTATSHSLYDPNPASGAINQNHLFRHLLNVFQSDDMSDSMIDAPNLHNIFAYTNVPSLFAGTEHFLNPATFTNKTSATGINGFNAPYNRVSAYREPGRMNLNTIFQREVYEGLFGAADASPNSSNVAQRYRGGHDKPAYDLFVKSRAGFTGMTPTSAQPNPEQYSGIVHKAGGPQLPTFFANPFRGPEDANMVPSTAVLGAGNENILVRPGTEPTLFRGNYVDPITSTSTQVDRRPLFENSPPGAQQHPYNEHVHNPYFRFESLQRLGNLTTQRSNVYAIWITSGYFEVDSAGKLGREVGSDRGDVKRHRMFSIVDRSIPFGYEPGKNHNIERTVLIKRFIE